MNTEEMHVPFSRPELGDEEADAIANVLRSGWLTTGQQAAEFEREFSSYIGNVNSLAVSSCTAGLHLALSALNVGQGDEVITTPLTYCATVQAIEETGAKVVFCDVGPDLNLDVALLPRVITNRTRCIIPVHIAGLPCRMDEIWQFAREHGLFVIEDAAHAIGSEYRGARVGSGNSEATVFSFFANKNMTTGEGGMITSSNQALLERMRLMSRHGVRRLGNTMADRLPWQYEVVDRGLKCNMSDIQAAMGRVQLRKLDGMLARREEIAHRYLGCLRDCTSIELPQQPRNARHAWHLFVIRLHLSELSITRDAFTRELAKRGVECSVHFIPIPMHSYYRNRFPGKSRYVESLAQFPRLVSLPIYPGMTDSQVDFVAASVIDVAASFRHSGLSHKLHEANV
jgi:dTDP-4-amino-4,6-dideoxygalactose transaminase